MSRKLWIGVTPLLATVAFAVLPVAAQATPHWFKNNVKMAEGTKALQVLSGKLTLKTVVGGSGEVTCQNVVGAVVENPTGEGPGKDETQSFNPYSCVASTCPLFAEVLAEKLPWPSELEETEVSVGVWRDLTSGVKVNVLCWESKAAKELNESEARKGEPVTAKPLGNLVSVGANKPEVKHGTSCAHPGFLEFDAGSGELEAEGSSGTVLGKTEGKLKGCALSSTGEPELLNVKNA